MKSLQQAQIKKPLAKVWMVLILGSLTAFGPLSLDMYLPSLPIVAKDMHSTASSAQLSLTFCLLGLALGQLFFGPLSDVRGRRQPLVLTLILYSISSILCAFSPNIWVLIALRFIQGLTGAAGIVIARATARDLYSGKDLTKFVSLLALVNGAAPILTPISGGSCFGIYDLEGCLYHSRNNWSCDVFSSFTISTRNFTGRTTIGRGDACNLKNLS